ncbi:MAG: hypothetical protein JWN86_926 [Planctomycetota bacterium]|nr:hypothetical protein [Planctomycetota bacterium]
MREEPSNTVAEAAGPVSSRDISEHLSRCVATMVFYHKDGASWSGAQLLWDEARFLRAWADESGSGEALITLVLSPLEGELSGRFGPEVGRRLHHEFLRAVKDAAEA